MRRAGLDRLELVPLISIYPDPDDVDLLDCAICVMSDVMYVTGISPGLLYKGNHVTE